MSVPLSSSGRDSSGKPANTSSSEHRDDAVDTAEGHVELTTSWCSKLIWPSPAMTAHGLVPVLVITRGLQAVAICLILARAAFASMVIFTHRSDSMPAAQLCNSSNHDHKQSSLCMCLWHRCESFVVLLELACLVSLLREDVRLCPSIPVVESLEELNQQLGERRARVRKDIEGQRLVALRLSMSWHPSQPR